MTKTTPKYTSLRGKVYWLHYKLPAAIYKQSYLTTPLIRLSLNTRDYVKAASLAQILVIKLVDFCKSIPIEKISKRLLDEVIINTMVGLGEATNQSIQRASKPSNPLTISSAFKEYDNEMVSSDVWRIKTRCDYHAAIANLMELTDDIELSLVDASYCRKYKNKLINYPLHRHKLSHTKNTNVNDIINSKETYPKISTTTVNNQIRKVNTFFNWLVKQGFILSNPINRMKIKQKISPKAARTSFNEDDIYQIFSSKIYTEHCFNHDYQYWLPLLALYSGARLEELCQLHLGDIHLDSPIPHYDINDSFEGQHIKNNSSRRCIPVHPELMTLGFNTFISQKITNGETMLFGYLVPQRQQLGHKPSQWFSKYKSKLGINSKKKVFHSFRHTMVDSLKNIRALDYEIKALLGHKNGSITHDVYGALDMPIDSIYRMLLQLSFEHMTPKIKGWR